MQSESSRQKSQTLICLAFFIGGRSDAIGVFPTKVALKRATFFIKQKE
jgi:hypothetical protein